jgi:hypothetical protein
LFKYFGLVSAILAHIVYDIAMFSLLKYAPINFKWKRKIDNQ